MHAAREAQGGIGRRAGWVPLRGPSLNYLHRFEPWMIRAPALTAKTQPTLRARHHLTEPRNALPHRRRAVNQNHHLSRPTTAPDGRGPGGPVSIRLRALETPLIPGQALHDIHRRVERHDRTDGLLFSLRRHILSKAALDEQLLHGPRRDRGSSGVPASADLHQTGDRPHPKGHAAHDQNHPGHERRRDQRGQRGRHGHQQHHSAHYERGERGVDERALSP
mmetsp:Transcript_45961/g.127740  ORF Transcript_45961/g.127740 Transcript_45961/m.127740 type:complete len:221 (+) Transcript_45961:636-1298(+)